MATEHLTSSSIILLKRAKVRHDLPYSTPATDGANALLTGTHQDALDIPVTEMVA